VDRAHSRKERLASRSSRRWADVCFNGGATKSLDALKANWMPDFWMSDFFGSENFDRLASARGECVVGREEEETQNEFDGRIEQLRGNCSQFGQVTCRPDHYRVGRAKDPRIRRRHRDSTL
jgi:hypothetical protein